MKMAVAGWLRKNEHFQPSPITSLVQRTYSWSWASCGRMECFNTRILVCVGFFVPPNCFNDRTGKQRQAYRRTHKSKLPTIHKFGRIQLQRTLQKFELVTRCAAFNFKNRRIVSFNHLKNSKVVLGRTKESEFGIVKNNGFFIRKRISVALNTSTKI